MRLALAALLFAGPAIAAPGGPVRVEWPVPASGPVPAALTALGGRDDLEIVSVRSSLTMTHVRLRQLAPDGTPLLGDGAAVHLGGAAPLFRARYLAPAAARVVLSGERRLDARAASARALAAVAGATGIAASEAVALPLGPGVARPGYWLAVDAAGPRLLEVTVDADDGTVIVGRDLLVAASGTGKVFRPNPITESGDRTLTDSGDADSAELTLLREAVTLEGLDGSGLLRGDFVDAQRRGTRLSQPSLIYDLTRGQVGFEEVSAYYHIDRVQRYVQSLGFTGNLAIWGRPIPVFTDWTPADQSFYDPVRKQLELGTGGVDDGEDGDVMAHEYGHALEFELVPGYGKSDDAQALGEGWGDTLAGAVPTLSEHPAVVERACLAAWDASAYDPPLPCMRRVDGTGHWPEALVAPREPHYDGEIWSGALYDLFQQPDVGPSEGLRIVLESMFLYAQNESFAAAGQALLDADRELDGGAHQATIRRLLVWHGILGTLTAPAPDGPVVASAPLDIAQGGGSGLDVMQTVAVPGATALRLHFASMSLDTKSTCTDTLCDAVYLYGKDGALYARLGGERADFDGPIVSGDEITVRYITRAGSTSTGFRIDRYGSIDSIDSIGASDVDAGPGAPDAAMAPPMKTAESGGCRVASGGGGAWWLVAMVLLRAPAARRRRR